MKIKTGKMFPLDHASRWPRIHWYWCPRFGLLYKRPYLVFLNRFWWLWNGNEGT